MTSQYVSKDEFYDFLDNMQQNVIEPSNNYKIFNLQNYKNYIKNNFEHIKIVDHQTQPYIQIGKSNYDYNNIDAYGYVVLSKYDVSLDNQTPSVFNNKRHKSLNNIQMINENNFFPLNNLPTPKHWFAVNFGDEYYEEVTHNGQYTSVGDEKLYDIVLDIDKNTHPELRNADGNDPIPVPYDFGAAGLFDGSWYQITGIDFDLPYTNLLDSDWSIAFNFEIYTSDGNGGNVSIVGWTGSSSNFLGSIFIENTEINGQRQMFFSWVDNSGTQQYELLDRVNPWEKYNVVISYDNQTSTLSWYLSNLDAHGSADMSTTSLKQDVTDTVDFYDFRNTGLYDFSIIASDIIVWRESFDQSTKEWIANNLINDVFNFNKIMETSNFNTRNYRSTMDKISGLLTNNTTTKHYFHIRTTKKPPYSTVENGTVPLFYEQISGDTNEKLYNFTEVSITDSLRIYPPPGYYFEDGEVFVEYT